MKQLTPEWVQKAEGDFEIMEREARSRSPTVYDGICFHAQQCAEKYLKARLYDAGIPFKPIHDLTVLLEQVLVAEPLWEVCRADLAFLADFAVGARYPGAWAGRHKALDARARCRRFRQAARASLGLDPQAKLGKSRRKSRTRKH